MARRDLHDLPKFQDRWSYLYLEHGRIDRDASSLSFYDQQGETQVPIDQLAFLMLGPGTRITHAAVTALADNNCLVCWVGEQGVRLYAASTGGTHSAHRLLHQARLWADERQRMRVAVRMYAKRFTEPISPNLPIEALRAMEGRRVRRAYEEWAAHFGLQWLGRAYDQDHWSQADPLNRALSVANACLYGICHAAILSAGYSPAIGFIHTGKMLSFVYDIADLYKTEVSIPAAFGTVARGDAELERRVRLACRDIFFEAKLMSRILPDIAEVLDARDDVDERTGELEGRAVSMADRAAERRLLGEPECPDPRPALGQGNSQVPQRLGPPDLERSQPPGL